MDQKVILAVDIGGSKYVVGLIREDGTIISKKKYQWTWIDPKSVISQLEEAMRSMQKEQPDVRIAGIGMTIPGLADPREGIWVSSSFMGIYDLPIKKIIEKDFGYPVEIENDCNACALAEKRFGCCADTDDFIYITVSSSIGGALFLDGKLYRGARGNAGELGICFVEKGKCFSENRRGKLEDYASGRGLTASYQSLGGKPAEDGWALDGEYIAFLSRKGDPAARKAFELEGEYLGKVLAAACAVLDPKKVIIGGGLSLAFDQYMESLLRTMKKELAVSADDFPEMRPTALGYDGALLGAAAVYLEELVNRSQ